MLALQSHVAALTTLFQHKRRFDNQGLALALVVMSALVTWKGLIVWTNSQSPIVVVLRCRSWVVSFLSGLAECMFSP